MDKNKLTGLFFIVFFGSLCLYPAYPKSVKGVVFEDTNHNGIRDAGERGIANVLVSDQRMITGTDEAGQYELEVDTDAVIFIIKPSGYATPVDDHNLPRFYYIHQPQGSPQQKYTGVKASGELPEALNFPLIKYEEAETFDVIVFSDPQPRDPKEIGYIRDDVAAELVGTEAMFGITLGDIMYDSLSLYQDYNSVLAPLGIPFYNVPGNHDENYDSADDLHALETFKSQFGPTYYSFNYGKVHFIVLDDVEWRNKGEEKPHYVGRLGEQQLEWLENDLKFVPADHLIVFTMHIPFYTFLSNEPSVNLTDRDKLFELIKTRQYLLALAGHMHMIEHQFLDKKQGWQGEKPMHHITCAAVSGTWWGGPEDERGIPIADQRDGVPNGYHLFTFSGNTYQERFKAAGKDDDYQLRISFPTGEISRKQLADSLIIVNVFNGSEKSTVEFSIDNGSYNSLKPEIRVDPFFVTLFNMHKEMYSKWIEPQRSNHIWTVKFPDNLATGVHSLRVRAKDQYGQIFQLASIFELVE